MTAATLLETIELATAPDAEPATASVIVMHGLGADGSDFVPVAEMMNLKSLGAVRFIFPHAPVRPVTINGGYPMRAWYDILGMDLVRREDEAGLRQSREHIEALIAREVARGVPARRIVLMGFSQGCAMALMTGLRHPDRLAGLVALSGYLPLAETTAREASAANRDLPIFMAHGDADGVVPVSRAEASRDALVELGYPVQWQTYAMQHSVLPEEIGHIAAFLRRVLA
jgi:phospholipase/carboxylesterase